MSSEPFIRARGLGKKFRFYDHPWHHLSSILLGRGARREHQALQELDLDLQAGDCLGIVGRNGAGKSTLLELICGVLRPSQGTVETNGRIAALLQLGAGFNPEFTGRENVFLSASLYGLSTAEISKRFAAIEAFAGIGDFIDRPVREYSSGMYARLAFSVCAHVDADILVIDEALGVGDVKFQQQSMKFLRAFRKKGIVLFVSHDEHAVAALCRQAIWIDAGRVVARGITKDVLHQYRREMSRRMGDDGDFASSETVSELLDVDQMLGSASFGTVFDPNDPPQVEGAGEIENVTLTFFDGSPVTSVTGGEYIRLAVSSRAFSVSSQPHLVFVLRDSMGQIIFSGDSRSCGQGSPASMDDGDVLDCEFDFILPYLPTGSYPIEVYFHSVSHGGLVCHDHREIAAVFQVLSHHISSGMANLKMDRTLLLVGTGSDQDGE
ncbi:ABC transporter ATP-binding protein [Pseudaminobacter sp. NGMCC 1.201702]|uniref:ABC transporter ATP-binding protein n=1 Tax=Pseudaminobacter sp. NGMCC 1.201702 TaxID=3391825 RepID=UPI0039EFB4F6